MSRMPIRYTVCLSYAGGMSLCQSGSVEFFHLSMLGQKWINLLEGDDDRMHMVAYIPSTP